MTEVLFFGADYCPACISFKPTAERITQENGAVFRYMDTELEKDKFDSYQISGFIPLTVIIANNGEVVEKVEGAFAEDTFVKYLQKAAANTTTNTIHNTGNNINGKLNQFLIIINENKNIILFIIVILIISFFANTLQYKKLN